MIVNISRNKLLINKNRFRRSARKDKKEHERCNHCGGLIRKDGDLASCIMCSRDKEHFCDRCSYKPVEPEDKKKKSA